MKYDWDWINFYYNPNKLREEIDNGRPVYYSIMSNYNTNIDGATGINENEEVGHAIVVYGYYGDNLITNFGCGNFASVLVLNTSGNYYDTSIFANGKSITIYGKLEGGVKLKLTK